MKALLHTTYPRQLLGQLHPENNSKPWVLCAENQTMPKKLIEQIFQIKRKKLRRNIYIHVYAKILKTKNISVINESKCQPGLRKIFKIIFLHLVSFTMYKPARENKDNMNPTLRG